MQYTEDLFRKNLFDAVVESNLSNAEIARRIDVSRSTITKWLKGVSSPTQSKIIHIARTLNKEPSWFFIDHSVNQAQIANLNQAQLLIANTIDPAISEEDLKQILTYIRFVQDKQGQADS
ncbi:helix-turn-helix domain-containing protein [Oenococcus kitaharae]|uniref:HTH cro/C1-type domain-containing protein n=1 Tax=Oenococcus kitaharae DSM 17330 TaxID=1045004 RepID=G9WJM0_9LACO|nr:helix-turn-helix transcriptional regulator [Oenococcus kitaharae]EHN59065.1 hypothetical protein OKIT_0962 [Oenococcus kitaharae DSM 17330]OEY83714.1 hypothetical protein NT96_05415 [Oenococcus kitaharae]OEY83886.1 hypothetical protein NT95_03255 [Oenococcus kitaharae]OEY84163.1 hypothetical protein NV75_04715 [Oenococcus kitaharae]